MGNDGSRLGISENIGRLFDAYPPDSQGQRNPAFAQQVRLELDKPENSQLLAVVNNFKYGDEIPGFDSKTLYELQVVLEVTGAGYNQASGRAVPVTGEKRGFSSPELERLLAADAATRAENQPQPVGGYAGNSGAAYSGASDNPYVSARTPQQRANESAYPIESKVDPTLANDSQPTGFFAKAKSFIKSIGMWLASGLASLGNALSRETKPDEGTELKNAGSQRDDGVVVGPGYERQGYLADQNIASQRYQGGYQRPQIDNSASSLSDDRYQKIPLAPKDPRHSEQYQGLSTDLSRGTYYGVLEDDSTLAAKNSTGVQHSTGQSQQTAQTARKGELLPNATPAAADEIEGLFKQLSDDAAAEQRRENAAKAEEQETESRDTHTATPKGPGSAG